MTAISKIVHCNVLDGIVNKYNNTVHRTIKMKPIEVTDDFYAEYNEDSNKKNPKFKVGDHVRISKYKNIFAKFLKKLKIQFHGLMLLMILIMKRLLEVFMKKNCRKLIKKNLE